MPVYSYKISGREVLAANSGSVTTVPGSLSVLGNIGAGTNTISANTISGSSISWGSSIITSFVYSNTLVFSTGTVSSVSIGGGPGAVKTNFQVPIGKATIGTSPSSAIGIFHVNQTASLGGTSGNYLELQTLSTAGGSGGNTVYIKDYAVRDATGTNWTTWRHHNGIQVDSSFDTPTTSRCFWERDPDSGFQYFGHSNVYTLTVDGANNRVGVANTAPGYPLHVNADVSGTSIYASADIVAYSDASVKENIRPIENVIERIQQSRGVLYDRTDIESNDNIGFIAQELEIAFPELIVTNEDGTKAVKYQNTVAVLFEAIKEQQKQIEELKQIINGITK
jgi:hypothetical protein